MLTRFFKQISTLFLIILSPIIQAQENGDVISFGDYRKLHSKILKEDRPLLVHLPGEYHETKKHYPLIIQLDGSKSQYLRGISFSQAEEAEREICIGSMPLSSNNAGPRI